MGDMIERVARAISLCNHDDDAEWAVYIPDARAAILAMKYDDGPEDEARLIAASNTYRVEAVSLAEAWDSIIEAALVESMPSPEFIREIKQGGS